MLHLLDESLESMLRRQMRISKADVDVAFDAPDNEWAGRVTKPTINLFLWDIRRSTDESVAGRERVMRNGREMWQDRPPRLAFSYLVTAWTTETRDEHRLLGQALQALLATPEIAAEHLVGELAELSPLPSLRVARPQAKDFAEFWSAIDGQLKPGLDVTVVATVDPQVGIPAGPPTERFETVLVDRTEPGRTSTTSQIGGHVDDPAAIGAMVSSPHGKAYINENGDFLVPAEPGDTITLHLAEAETYRPSQGNGSQGNGSQGNGG